MKIKNILIVKCHKTLIFSNEYCIKPNLKILLSFEFKTFKMKKILLLFAVIFTSLPVSSQTKTPTQQEAKKYLGNQEFPIRYNLTQEEDKELFDTLLKIKQNEILILESKIYKILRVKTVNRYNAAYIFIDRSKLSDTEVINLEKEILDKYKNGESFSDLALKYTMDQNPKADELIFYDAQMVPEFENAVREHKAGEVFTVETPDKKWFHIIKKNEETRKVVAIELEYAEYQ